MKLVASRLIVAGLFVLMMAAVVRAAPSEPVVRLVADQIEDLLGRATQEQVFLGDAWLPLFDQVRQFYQERDFAAVWFGESHSAEQASVLMQFLRAAEEDGLHSQGYHLGLIEQLRSQVDDYGYHEVLFDSLAVAQLDLLLSHAFVLHASRLSVGQVDPNELYAGEWRARLRRTDVVAALNMAVQSGDVAGVLHDLAPAGSEYLHLREELQRYRLIQRVGGWPRVPEGEILRRGGTDPRVAVLRQRLWMSGDLVAPDAEYPQLYQGDIVAAVVRFQRRHGLSPDGAVGPKTLAELNRSVEERIRQMELNLERRRWLPEDLGSRHIIVNIADFSLQVVEQGRVVMHMPVVVGTTRRKTPVFSGRMTYLEFAPYWGVPPTILQQDKLPRIRADRGYLDANHYEIIPWRGPSRDPIHPSEIDWQRATARTFPGLLRQRPGPWNPLGQVKFMFPNDLDIYLHDSPDRHLFNRRERTFSSGCIRVERAADLAQYLLEDQPAWDCDRLHRALNASEPKQVTLRRPIAVHLVYFTAWVDNHGVVQFRSDPYQRDNVLAVALDQQRNLSVQTASFKHTAEGDVGN
ncbi:L,D-transpeptidase family protein [Geoalkalibacter halelectricus]|uniref:L,D-transpeptidase family protein n=1 Tax=Geoalkalibacter halelectricus TaxID=2847045 RepID=A0ABY5ZQ42_9BACT|nr:L,D-transpeptidase family protein [Geoalkalibacter halelectricus]MDO3376991.1 L,D-transpeptidase family protein [Geoalkalibacter halelectricus]UWZ81213.1 L,D-transpeptidase family protein [Geoalkalibacter halelectricus]